MPHLSERQPGNVGATRTRAEVLPFAASRALGTCPPGAHRSPPRPLVSLRGHSSDGIRSAPSEGRETPTRAPRAPLVREICTKLGFSIISSALVLVVPPRPRASKISRARAPRVGSLRGVLLVALALTKSEFCVSPPPERGRGRGVLSPRLRRGGVPPPGGGGFLGCCRSGWF